MPSRAFAPWFRVALALFGVGWGANQFASMLLVYRQQDHLSQQIVTAMFAAYILGLMPALLVSAALAGRFGHRAIIRPVMITSLVATLLLIAGADNEGLLFAGRVLSGVVAGAAMAPGTTWVKELSAGAPHGTGARRATVALTSGFGGGPLVAGLAAQWLPAPKITPYVFHLVAMALIIVIAWSAPAPAKHLAKSEDSPPSGHAALSRHFWTRIAPPAPWVFTCASVGIVVLPAIVQSQLAGWSIAFTAVMCAVTLGSGVLIQPTARRLEAQKHGRPTVWGMTTAVAGTLLCVCVQVTKSVWLVPITGVVLGCAYGMVLVGGLTAIERSTSAGQLAFTNATFYCLTYVGFTVPTIIATLVKHIPQTTVLWGLTALAVVTVGSAMASQARGARSQT